MQDHPSDRTLEGPCYALETIIHTHMQAVVTLQTPPNVGWLGLAGWDTFPKTNITSQG
jgi:hypothetical protein